MRYSISGAAYREALPALSLIRGGRTWRVQEVKVQKRYESQPAARFLVEDPGRRDPYAALGAEEGFTQS